MNKLINVEKEFMRNDIPDFRIGDTLRFHLKIIEGEKSRIQVFEATVIARSGSMHREVVRLRKLSYGIGVERTFPLHSPTIEKIEVVKRGVVRRAKLYYLRSRVGKAAKIAESESGAKTNG